MTSLNSISNVATFGALEHADSGRKTDFLYRVSLKGLVRNAASEVLVVKETGRSSWDLPGGGMDHGESLQQAIARELHEEIQLQGEFSYQIIHVDEPVYLHTHAFWQTRLIFEISPSDMCFAAGVDADEIAFMDPEIFKNSNQQVERKIYDYAQLLQQDKRTR